LGQVIDQSAAIKTFSVAAWVNFVAGVLTHVSVVLARGTTSSSNQRNRHQGQNNLLFHQLTQVFGAIKLNNFLGFEC
jgi:hypothetical protein